MPAAPWSGYAPWASEANFENAPMARGGINERYHQAGRSGDNCIDLYDQTGDAYPGGNPVNVAVYTVRLGGKASYTGVVGNDKYGELMRRAVADKGVDVSPSAHRAGLYRPCLT